MFGMPALAHNPHIDGFTIHVHVFHAHFNHCYDLQYPPSSTMTLHSDIIMFNTVQASLESMQLFQPIEGQLRRTRHSGFSTEVKISQDLKEFELIVKSGYIQV